jgi:hypothetical protein
MYTKKQLGNKISGIKEAWGSRQTNKEQSWINKQRMENPADANPIFFGPSRIAKITDKTLASEIAEIDDIRLRLIRYTAYQYNKHGVAPNFFNKFQEYLKLLLTEGLSRENFRESLDFDSQILFDKFVENQEILELEFKTELETGAENRARVEQQLAFENEEASKLKIIEHRTEQYKEFDNSEVLTAVWVGRKHLAEGEYDKGYRGTSYDSDWQLKKCLEIAERETIQRIKDGKIKLDSINMMHPAWQVIYELQIIAEQELAVELQQATENQSTTEEQKDEENQVQVEDQIRVELEIPAETESSTELETDTEGK